MAPLSILLVVLVWSSGLQIEVTEAAEPDDVRLVEGGSRCAGRLEIKHQGEWRPVSYWWTWSMQLAVIVCRQLDCGAAVSTEWRSGFTPRPSWRSDSHCFGSESALRKCGTVMTEDFDSDSVEVICSESVRLADGYARCSGRVEVKSGQSWVSVCEADFDLQDAEVVCRQSGCGAPLALQGALYGRVSSVMAPVWTKEFQCDGSESRLLDCVTSDSVRDSCSPGKAVRLTCSEPDDVRLVEGASRCAGNLEIKHQGEWRPLSHKCFHWNQRSAVVVCRQLGCGPFLSTEWRSGSTEGLVWRMDSPCSGSESALRDCGAVRMGYTNVDSAEVICSVLRFQPHISLYSSIVGVSEGQQQGLQVFLGYSFTITCSIQPQYPGGSFHLTFTSSNRTNSQSQTAVNHSALFLFPAVDNAHQGNYSCVYHINVFNHNFSSESEPFSLTVSASPLPDCIIRVVVVLTVLVVSNTALYLYFKTTRGQKLSEENPIYDNIELVSLPGRAEAGQREGRGAQDTE